MQTSSGFRVTHPVCMASTWGHHEVTMRSYWRGSLQPATGMFNKSNVHSMFCRHYWESARLVSLRFLAHNDRYIDRWSFYVFAPDFIVIANHRHVVYQRTTTFHKLELEFAVIRDTSQEYIFYLQITLNGEDRGFWGVLYKKNDMKMAYKIFFFQLFNQKITKRKIVQSKISASFDYKLRSLKWTWPRHWHKLKLFAVTYADWGRTFNKYSINMCRVLLYMHIMMLAFLLNIFLLLQYSFHMKYIWQHPLQRVASYFFILKI